jgi:putative ABC transport system permease protein
VLICGCNFVNLMTVSNARRGVEVGIRKVAGASRADLLWQVIGEAVLVVMRSTLLALALVNLLALHLSGFLMRPLAIDWLQQPGLLGAVLALVAVLGVLAGPGAG